jgi:hypothetical protein
MAWPRSSLVIAVLAAVSAFVLWYPMLGGWWYVINWHEWPSMMHANHQIDWTKYWAWLDSATTSFGSKVTRPGYFLIPSAFLIAFRDQPILWFGGTVVLFVIGVFAITVFVSRLAGPVFGFFFAGFLLLHPMWSEIILELQSELFAFVGMSVGALLTQRAYAKYSSLSAVLAICFGVWGIFSKENIALSALACLPIIGLAILVWSRMAAIRLSWILIGWWLASLIMLAGIIHGMLIGREGGRAVDLYGREIGASIVWKSFLIWKIFWLPLFAIFLIAALVLAFLVFRNRAGLSGPRDVLNRFSTLLFAVLVSAAGTVCALVNVACYREIIQGRYLFPLALIPWLVFAALIWAFYQTTPVLRRGFGFIPALGALLIAVVLAWPKDASIKSNFQSVAHFREHTSFIRSTLEDARRRCVGKAHPKVVFLSHDFNDYEPVVAVDIFLGYLNVPGHRYLLREGYSLESAKDGSQRFLWNVMEKEVEKGVLLRATEDDLKEADFVIQFSAPDNLKANFPNLWPLYLHQD